MPGDETRQKTHDESDSESEEEDVLDNIPKVDIDVTKLKECQCVAIHIFSMER